jgi:thioredoxin 1
MPTVELTKDNFEATINDNDTVIVDFWAEWCGPCKMFGPTFEEASDQHSDIVFGKVDTEAQPELAGFFNVRSIPTLMVFRENVVLYSQPGALPPETFQNLVEQIKEVDMEDVHRQVAEAQAAEDNGEKADEHDHADHEH